ncbi:uncharacterized protein TRUGW13939_04293 [Talaromyces rugulosus]|uniref:Uncharacterized protein n=1 Tax=Talaromyces rugulosus TaxID=121627 RepID=A0A7H8QUP7_TALRU|nr:uncharacterized protein TRUGW13939_04293 [Talaromyces rugulosus]QKX57185.1 hypothetical protein TRUGW13939_04293 [Talaromyces rugulosus]
MSQASEDLSTQALDAFNRPSISIGSGEEAFEPCLESTTPPEAIPTESLSHSQPILTTSKALTDPSVDNALDENHNVAGPPVDDNEAPPPYPIEWKHGIAPHDTGEGPSRSANAPEVSKWSSSSGSTAAEPAPSLSPDDRAALVEALALTPTVSAPVVTEPIPECGPATNANAINKTRRGPRSEFARVRARYFWRRTKALKRRAATFLSDLAFYGIFNHPARDPLTINAEVIDGISITESELRELRAYEQRVETTCTSPRPSSPILVPNAPEGPHPDEEEQTAPQGGRKYRVRVATGTKRFVTKALKAIKSMGRKRG